MTRSEVQLQRRLAAQQAGHPRPWQVPSEEAPRARSPWAPYRNKGESLYARWLESAKGTGLIEWWAYETIKLRLSAAWFAPCRRNKPCVGRANGAWFTPDFLVRTVTGQVELHEYKGFMREAGRLRLLIAAERYPMFRFFVVRQLGNGQFVWTEVKGERL